jgi:hypothetical protein
MILGDHSSAGTSIRLNNDTGTSYSARFNANGAGEATDVSRSSGGFITDSRTNPHFNVTYLANLSTKEKLWQNQNVYNITTGAATAPLREEAVGKWSNTSNAVDEFAYLAWAGSYSSGDECVVLGWDDSDTHTTNFWEELASVELLTDNQNFSTGSFAAKKYLWIQFFQQGHTGNQTLTFNSDTASNYSKRISANGGADATTTSASNLINMTNAGTADPSSFGNLFIVNNSANEKLIIGNSMANNAAGAGNSPFRVESAAKWANTSAQITSVQINDDGGAGFDTGSILKIWGSD